MRAGLWQTLVLVVAGGLAGRSAHGDVLNRDAVRGDVVDLTRRGHVDQVVGLNLDLVSGGQERVEAHDEVRVSLKQLGDAVDDSRSVYAAGTEGATAIQC